MRFCLHCVGKATLGLTHVVLPGLGSSPQGILHRPPECLHAVAAGYSQSDLREQEPKMENGVFLKLIAEVTYAIITFAACYGPYRTTLVIWEGSTRGVKAGSGDPWAGRLESWLPP